MRDIILPPKFSTVLMKYLLSFDASLITIFKEGNIN